MKKTILYDHHVALKAKMIDFNGFLMPLNYQSILEEHQIVRSDVGVFDVSHMGQIVITGKDAYRFVNLVVTNDILWDNHKMFYALLVDDHGHILDDLMVYPINQETIMLVVNASNIDKDYQWLLKHKEQFQVKITNISDSISLLAIQGPRSSYKLKAVMGDIITTIPFMHFMYVTLFKEDVLVSRSGYTGEDGYEIYASNIVIKKIFELLIQDGVKPIGLGARDTLRFEAGLPLYGNELTDKDNPYEAGLGFAVKLKKTAFIGKESLMKQKKDITKKLVGIRLLEKGILRHGYVITKDNITIGYITTGYLLPGHKESLAYGYVDVRYANIDENIEIIIRDKSVKAQVIDKRFFNKNYHK